MRVIRAEEANQHTDPVILWLLRILGEVKMNGCRVIPDAIIAVFT